MPRLNKKVDGSSYYITYAFSHNGVMRHVTYQPSDRAIEILKERGIRSGDEFEPELLSELLEAQELTTGGAGPGENAGFFRDRNTDNNPVICDSCKSSLRVDALSHNEYQLLQGQHRYDILREELSMLLRVQNLYRRHPEIETIASGTCLARLFEEVEPTYNTAMLSSLADSDFEILEYLRNNAFALTPRLQFVREQMAQLELFRKAVACPVCKVGKLKLDPSTWIDPLCVVD